MSDAQRPHNRNSGVLIQLFCEAFESDKASVFCILFL